MSEQKTSRARLEAFFRGRSEGGLTLSCEGRVWTASAVVTTGAQGPNGQSTTTIDVIGHGYVNGIEESCEDVIGLLAEADVEVP